MIFDGLKEKVLSLFDHVMQPKVLVCDATQSIRNAFIAVFGTTPVIPMCWAHAKKNMHPKAFVEKWQTQTEFIHYFKEEWLKKHPNWFLGAAPCSPATNNALEAFNRNIKDQNTLRERLPLSHFLTIATEMVAQWSLQSCKEPLPETPTIELKDWTDGFRVVNAPIAFVSLSSLLVIVLLALFFFCCENWRRLVLALGVKKYAQKYCKEWEYDPNLKDWICPDPTGENYARCKYCKVTLVPHKKELNYHAKSKKHIKAVSLDKAAKSCQQLPFIKTVSKNNKTAELKTAAYIVEHSAIQNVDHLGEILPCLDLKSEVLGTLKIHRTKCSMLIKKRSWSSNDARNDIRCW
ncbi:unnamed protein product [Parnassius apollo]|uniref:(apollo) hypothetical protein n=1 Tax=Parnassius apollo TaxID=110799 RepID=A0A8S3Y400_PARAO|nr:unnamed protein product [Parnassius apollo]